MTHLEKDCFGQQVQYISGLQKCESIAAKMCVYKQTARSRAG